MIIWVKLFRLNRHFLKVLILLVNCCLINVYSSPESTLIEEDFSIYDEWNSAEGVINDPLEGFNRLIYDFNDISYDLVLKPTAAIYQSITNKPIRNCFKNFFYNLKYPIRLTSNLFQCKFKNAYYESLQFSLNTTIGMLGLFKPSDKFEKLSDIPEEDLGQLFAFWGIPEGPYIILPFLGPSTMRELPARFSEPIINPFDSPVGIMDNIDKEWLITYNLIELLVLSSEILPQYNTINSVSIDPYIAVRNGFIMRRRQMIRE